MKYLKLFSLLILTSFLCLTAATGSTFTAVHIGTNGSPRGYWEYLPTAYANNPNDDFPLVIFFHGLGEGGNGTTDLHEVLRNGPPEILNDASHPLHGYFDTQSAIVLSPQVTNNTWWNVNHIRPFLDYVLSQYRVDRKRIYFTGLSAGSSGIHDFLNDDTNAHDVTAVMTVAVRGTINDTTGAAMAAQIPYWALTRIGDASNTAINSVNRTAGFMLGSAPTNVQANYPGSAITRTALFTPANGWTWQDGVVSTSGFNPKMTLYPGGGHNSWAITYNNVDCWTWLFDQVKPTVTISTPVDGTLVAQGDTVNLLASAVDAASNPITGTDLTWSSNLDGVLGTGPSLSVSNLSVGVHTVTCQAIDDQFRGNRASVVVTVAYAGTYRVLTDFGGTGLLTTGNWNNVSHKETGLVENAIDENGTSVGVRIEIQNAFDRDNSGGVAASDLYPETAQRDSFFVSEAVPQAEVLVSGLNIAQTYDFTFFASRSATNNRTGIYTIGNDSVSLNAANNTSNTVTLADVVPNASGQVLITLIRDPGAQYGYLGVLDITAKIPTDNDSLPDTWEMEQFGGLSESPEGDFDEDGLSNIYEYAVNGLANDASDRKLPVMTVVNEANGGGSNKQYLTLTYNRRIAPGNLTYAVYVSNQLSGWQNGDGVHTQVMGSPVANPDGITETVTVRDMVEFQTQTALKRFMRLEVSVP